MEGSLFRFVNKIDANGAGAACSATQVSAVSGRAGDMGTATGGVKALGAESTDRAPRQTRFFDAGRARVVCGRRGRSHKGHLKGQCRAVSMPKTEYGIDQQADRRFMHGSRRQSPAVKWRVRWAIGRIDGGGPKVRSSSIDHLFRPCVQTGQTCCAKTLPHLRTSVADQDGEFCLRVTAGKETAR